MVLWEITFGTTYFLGLKRTYKLFLKIQRKLISPKYPNLRDLAHWRTQVAFDVALTIHHKVQERVIEAGRNLGNWILRWLDKMKPSANIRGSNNNATTNASKQLTNSSHSPNPKTFQKYGAGKDKEFSSRHLFTSARNTWQKAYLTISMMIKPKAQLKQISNTGSSTLFCQIVSAP
ncbi:putative Plastid lipid-associated protein 3, chloroplast precursor [Capsicum annuum]|nr:putative Plastid lipid-associated protein 3, chloroplast precursor [Capsicum annuum]KAF3675675.1 putative Plastid lipid-associated protein 3, chloroplast precursor [Capsicum annuum]